MHAIKYCNNVQGLSYWQTQDLVKQQKVILEEINGRKTRRQIKRKFLTYQENTTKKAVEVIGNLKNLKNEPKKKKRKKKVQKKKVEEKKIQGKKKKAQEKKKKVQEKKKKIQKKKFPLVPTSPAKINPKTYIIDCDMLKRTYTSDILGFTILKSSGKVSFSKEDREIVDKQIVRINGWDCTASYDTPEFFTKLKERPLHLHFQRYEDVRSQFCESYLKLKRVITKNLLILLTFSDEIRKIEACKKDEKGLPKCSISEMNEFYQVFETIYEKMNIKK